MNTDSSKRRVLSGLLVLVCLCSQFSAWPSQAWPSQEVKVDYNQASAPILNFEKFIGEIIRLTLPGELGVVQRPKGALIDSGYIFMFLVNMNRGLIHSPMGTFADPTALSPAKKREKIDALKNLLVQLLHSHGAALPLLKKDKTVTIVAFFEETSLDEGTVSKRIVLSVLKSDIDDSVARQQGLNEFKNKVKIVEY